MTGNPKRYNVIRIYFDATCNVTYHVVMYNQITPEKMGNILIHAIGYYSIIAWADIRMGTIRNLRGALFQHFGLLIKRINYIAH